MKHNLHCESDHKDSPEGEGAEFCNICRGALSLCKVCGGAEGDLPKDCPGEKMSEAVRDRVMDGVLDFVDGKWVDL